MAAPLLRFTDKGIYCAKGDFYIDPWRGVDRAVLTHAHSDHARWGSKHYLAHTLSAPILKLRLGDINLQTVGYNEPLFINGVKISFHPAGHIIGSAQIRVESEGEVWVVSGDYKIENDGISGVFEPVPCHTFISESTFGLPVYRWQKQEEIFADINKWWAHNRENGKHSILVGYSLGKAQRILAHVDKSIGPIVAHTAIYNTQQAFINAGVPLYNVKRWTADLKKEELKGGLIVTPSTGSESGWLKRFEPYSIGVCSGWMKVRGSKRRQNADSGFALSDHADWDGLLQAVKDTGCQKAYITHGYQSVFSRYLNEIGIASEEVLTEYGSDEEELAPPPATNPQNDTIA